MALTHVWSEKIDTAAGGDVASGPYNASARSHTYDATGYTMLIIVIQANCDGTISVTSPQYAGNAITEIGQSDNTQEPGGSTWVGTISSPTTGSNEVTFTIGSSGTDLDSYAVHVCGSTDEETADPVGLLVTESVTSISATVTQNGSAEKANSIVYLFAASRDGTNSPPWTPGSGVTENFEGVTGTSATLDVAYCVNNKVVGSPGAVTVDTTMNVGDRRSSILVEFRETGGAVATTGGSVTFIGL